MRHGLVGGVGGVEPGQICILRLCAVVWSFDSKVLASSGDSKGEERGLYKALGHKEFASVCAATNFETGPFRFWLHPCEHGRRDGTQKCTYLR